MSDDGSSGVSGFGSVVVNYSAADIWAMNVFAWRAWFIPPSIVVMILIAIQLIFPMLEDQSFELAFGAIDWNLLGFLGILVFFIPIIVQIIVYAWRRFTGHHDEIEMRLLETGPSFKTKEMSGTLFWSSIRKVRSTNDRIFFFISGRSAMIVPRRCFEDMHRFDQWRDFSEKTWAAIRKSE